MEKDNTISTTSVVFLIVVAIVLFLILKIQVNTDKAKIENSTDIVSVDPISHASMILNWRGVAVYTDPVGDMQMFANKPSPDIILLTDIHGDHIDIKALEALSKDSTVVIAPMAVADMLPATIPGTLLVMKNGEKTNHKTEQKLDVHGFSIEAVPMYNFPESKDSRHPKGRGNGYIVEKDGVRVYISGDTARIPEIKNLKNIDMAFLSMNLPYTMGVEEAGEAVLDFNPKKVYPYHYRTPTGFSDVAKFKEIVNSRNPEIEVVQLDWYPK